MAHRIQGLMVASVELYVVGTRHCVGRHCLSGDFARANQVAHSDWAAQAYFEAQASAATKDIGYEVGQTVPTEQTVPIGKLDVIPKVR